MDDGKRYRLRRGGGLVCGEARARSFRDSVLALVVSERKKNSKEGRKERKKRRQK